MNRHDKMGELLSNRPYVGTAAWLIGGYSLFMRRIFCAASAVVWPIIAVTPDGTSFNIQNPIPHPSQKEKVLLETRRAKECQRGIAGAAERAKEGGRVPSESSDTRLGARCREFESPHSDQNQSKSCDFGGFFLTFTTKSFY